MFKLSVKLSVALVILTALVLIGLQSFQAKPVLSETPNIQTLNQPRFVATAPTPPSLVRAVLAGRPVYVLYVTQSEDTVLVRCYPTYEPTITVRAMGGDTNAKAQREGVMTCRPSA
ncbi:MAG: hypothetical protein KME55_33430 [Nostoc indistinguendum CM1-VF10]|jgi:hypothetical protein|nr:hypothetical protein [Nostoc indistinguendum CM1-VF10]